MTVLPLQLAFYKGAGGKNGALQFNMQRPHFYVKSNPKLRNYEGKWIPKEWRDENPNLTKDHLTSREGALFMEITSAVGKNDYDWTQKIIMALSITDLGKVLMILDGHKESVEIIHDPGAKSVNAGKVNKKLKLWSPKGIAVGVMVTVSEREGDSVKSHTVPLSGDEARVLQTCIKAAIPVALSWV